MSSKISGRYSRFSGGLYLHMFLLKQDLLELSGGGGAVSQFPRLHQKKTKKGAPQGDTQARTF